jgi:hypothetical protein
VVFSFYIDQSTTSCIACVSCVCHTVNSLLSLHIVWHCWLSYYNITERLFWTPAIKDFTAVILCYISKEAVHFWCLSNVYYTLLILFLNFVNWTNPFWSWNYEKVPHPGRHGFLNACRATRWLVLPEKLVPQGHKVKKQNVYLHFQLSNSWTNSTLL